VKRAEGDGTQETLPDRDHGRLIRRPPRLAQHATSLGQASHSSNT
jgi:hypothetical protein